MAQVIENLDVNFCAWDWKRLTDLPQNLVILGATFTGHSVDRESRLRSPRSAIFWGEKPSGLHSAEAFASGSEHIVSTRISRKTGPGSVFPIIRAHVE